jgi:hypothetical protein
LSIPTQWAGVVCVLVVSSASGVNASPTMVRLGYARCTACHLAPQGAGLLTDYGKGIDAAQSLEVSEYETPDPDQPRALHLDLRLLTSASRTSISSPGATPGSPPWLRTYLRGSAALGRRHRLSSSLVVEAPAGELSRVFETGPVVDVLGAWEYRHSDGFLLSVARDRLPRGVEVGETATLLQQGDVERYPAQVRALLAKGPLQVTAYGYGAGSAPALDRRSHGLGALGELHLFAGHAVLGGSVRRAFEETMDREHALDRQTIGAYVRLGFGKWGLLAEHEFTDRTVTAAQQWSSDRLAGYTQFFVAAREWLVTSLIAEQVLDEVAVHPRALQWRPEVQARFSPHFTITAGVRTDTVRTLTGATGTSRTYLVQAAVKTVQ